MANQAHLDILAKGVEAWNAWRESNVPAAPDLRDAPLSGVFLQAANFSNADLTGANLTGADLRNANLNHALQREHF